MMKKFTSSTLPGIGRLASVFICHPQRCCLQVTPSSVLILIRWKNSANSIYVALFQGMGDYAILKRFPDISLTSKN